MAAILAKLLMSRWSFRSFSLSEGISSTTSCGDTAIAASNSNSVTVDGTLAVRAKIVCTSSYAISEGDINALEVPSAASVTAKDVSGNAVNAFGTSLVSLDQVRANGKISQYYDLSQATIRKSLHEKRPH